MSSNQEIIKAIVYTGVNGIEYEGRLLGVITEEEFNRTINSKSLQAKTFTKPTLSIRAFASAFPKNEDVKGLRLVIAVRKRDERDLLGKHLYISEPMDFISKIGTPEKPEMTINAGNQSSYIVIEQSS